MPLKPFRLFCTLTSSSIKYGSYILSFKLIKDRSNNNICGVYWDVHTKKGPKWKQNIQTP